MPDSAAHTCTEKQKRHERLAMLADLFLRGLYVPDLTALALAMLDKEPQLFGVTGEGRSHGTVCAADRKKKMTQ